MAGLLMTLAATSTAGAQSCWPVAVLLEVRDEGGRRVDPAFMDSVVTVRTPQHVTDAERVRAPYHVAKASRDTTNLLQWAVSGCRLRLGRVTLYRRGQAMHLEFGMALDSERRRGPSTFQIQAPRFQPGTFRLRWDPAEPGGSDDDPQRLTDERWEHVEPHNPAASRESAPRSPGALREGGGAFR
jgi:hypothetical protein